MAKLCYAMTTCFWVLPAHLVPHSLCLVIAVNINQVSSVDDDSYATSIHQNKRLAVMCAPLYGQWWTMTYEGLVPQIT